MGNYSNKTKLKIIQITQFFTFRKEIKLLSTCILNFHIIKITFELLHLARSQSCNVVYTLKWFLKTYCTKSVRIVRITKDFLVHERMYPKRYFLKMITVDYERVHTYLNK